MPASLLKDALHETLGCSWSRSKAIWRDEEDSRQVYFHECCTKLELTLVESDPDPRTA
jgi:hypothetical protein